MSATASAASTSPSSPKRRPGVHGCHPLSLNTRKRLLQALLTKANRGDVGAIETLVKLSLHVERTGGAATGTEAV